MKPESLKALLTVLSASAGLLSAQNLTLPGAVAQALKAHPGLTAASANTEGASHRIAQAHAAALPRVNFSESVQGSNNPVFVFGSLLTQRQFTERNFALNSLNRPDFLANFQSLLGVDQTIYDGGRTKASVKSAEAGRSAAGESEKVAKLNVIANVARAYFDAVLAQHNAAAADEAIRSAEADVQRAESIRSAGMSTDADVLSIRVHLAAARERKIRHEGELVVAKAALNEGMGVPLDMPFELTTPLAIAAEQAAPAELESRAASDRPDVKQAAYQAQAAESMLSAARAARLPQVTGHAAFEADRQRFVTRAGSNWIFGASLRWNVFDGQATKAKVAEASSKIQAAQAMLTQVRQSARLDVRRAASAQTTAAQRVALAMETVAHAEESLRIIKNRFAAGLTTVTELLRAETALLESRTRHLAAIHDQRLASVALQLSAGILNENSEVLK